VAKKAIKQMKEFVEELLYEKMGERAGEISEKLTSGGWTHDYPLTIDKLKELGLEVSTEIPTLVYDLMELFPQPIQHRPSVQFIPFPYKKEGKNIEK